MERKKNRQRIYTENLIKSTFLELYIDKSFNSINVSELCERADMNRTTFYRFFQDVYDLFDAVVSDYIRLLIPKYTLGTENTGEICSKNEIMEYITSALAITEKNNAVYRKMLLDNGCSGIEEKLQSELFTLLDRCGNNKTADADIRQCMCRFVVFGLIGSWKDLVLNKCGQSDNHLIEVSSFQIDNYIRWSKK